jgi:hypothetical protein
MARRVLLLGVLQWSCCWSFLIPPRAESAEVGGVIGSVWRNPDAVALVPHPAPLCVNKQAAWPTHSGRRSERRSASGLRLRHLTASTADGGAAGAAIPDLADPLGVLDGVAYPEKAAFYSTSMGSGTSRAEGLGEGHHL